VETVSLTELLDALEEGRAGVVLLPNASAARELREAFDRRMQSRGVGAWEAPAVQSWGQWVATLWSEMVVNGAETRLLLNAAQEQSVWREIIAADSAHVNLDQVDTLVETAMSGWKLASAYEATGKLRGSAVAHDAKVFALWAEAFQRQCKTKGYVAAAQLEEALRVRAGHPSVAMDWGVTLVGFEETTPAQERLLEHLRELGVQVRTRALRGEVGTLRASIVAASEQEELEMVARWVRKFVADGGGRVALLVPGLGEQRAVLEDVLRAVLSPELEEVGSDLSSTPWEFSTGAPLGDLAIVMHALALAQWVDGALPLQRINGLLLSPYLECDDRDAVARFDAAVLRKTPLFRPEMGMKTLAELDRTKLLRWLRNVIIFLQQDGDRSKTRGFAEWMELVRGLSHAAGWPGKRTLTANEIAASEAWGSALDTVATLDFTGRRVSYATALQALEKQIRAGAVRAPVTGAAVQVMGVEEAEGSVWDAMVIMRATDAHWPPTERSHPLLPWALQKTLRMPGSDPGLAAERAKAFTAGLLTRSGNVLFTSAAEDESGKLRASPIVTELGLEKIAAEAFVKPAPVETQVRLENFEDDEELPSLPSKVVGGGAKVLKLQAACGFLAFAELRLRASEPENGELGLDAGESGSVLHQAMQAFWRTVKSQAALKAMTSHEREACLVEAIDGSLPRRLHAESGWDTAYVKVVKERLRAVLRQWLEMEMQRGPFEVIGLEKDEDVTVGPLTLSVRMDRVDRVGDGVFFVDYKTGYAADPKQWDGERPDDPQLPLYAMLPEVGELKGVAFAKVRAGSAMKWVGYQAEDGILPISKSKKNVRDMDALAEEWRGTLTVLAEDFAMGRSEVQPKSYEGTCTHCGQRLLCRLDPATLLAADEEDEGEDSDG
jgi:ATP-dependent helicase/nuclease subunit B